MDNSALIQLLMKNEMPSVSFFSEYSRFIIPTAVAMANGDGGYIMIGVSDTRTVVGVDDASIVEAQLTQSFRHVSPLLPYSINMQSIDGKDVLIIFILSGGKKPYLCDGVFYVMRSSEVCKATNEEIAKLFMQRENQDTSWERTPENDFEDTDLSEQAFARVRDNMVRAGHIDSSLSRDELLYKLGMRVDGHITKAGVVMFGSQPSRFIPQSRIRLSMYDNNDSLVQVRMYDQDIISNIETIVNDISIIYGNRIAIDSLERKVLEVIPMVALREGLFNACVHREYDSIETFVIVNLFANRLEIKNSGRLPRNLTIEELINTHVSIIRNPDIANACQQARFIEMAGSGIPRIIDVCRKNDCAIPKWTTDDSTVTLTFPNVYHGKTAIGDPIEHSLDYIDSSPIVKKDLLQIVQYIRTHQNSRTADIEKLTGKSNSTTRRYLYLLKSAGLIEYIGSRKVGSWQINSK